MQHIKTFISLAIIAFSFLSGNAFYVDLPTDNFRYINSDIKWNIDAVSKGTIVVNDTATFDTFNNELKAFTSLTGIDDFFESLRGAKEYKNTLDQLKQLPCASPGALIDSSWIIGAMHVLIHDIKHKTKKVIVDGKEVDEPVTDHEGNFEAADDAKNYAKTGIPQIYTTNIDKIFVHPAIDLALAHLKEPVLVGLDLYDTNSELIPIKRFRGTYNNQEIVAYSDTIHNVKSVVVAGDDHPCLAKCEIETAINSSTDHIDMKIIGPKPFIIRSYGGDSSGPIFIKVSETGDPHKDFELIGINEPKAETIGSIYLPNKDISTWIDNVIIAVALGKEPGMPYVRKLVMPRE